MIENQDKVSVYSSIRPKRTKKKVYRTEPTTHRDLGRVIEELKEMKKTKRDQSLDEEVDNNPLALKFQAKIVHQFLKVPKERQTQTLAGFWLIM